MLMSWIWTVMIGVSLLAALIGGQGALLGSAVLQGAQSGVTLCISMAGSICLWSGVSKVIERIGLTDRLGSLLQPLLGRVFPSSRQDLLLRRSLSGNVCANFLGLGNAATPLGIQAARRLAQKAKGGIASNELCRLIVLNTASIQLIPANVAAVRTSLGASSAFDILPAVWITSLLSAGAGLTAAWLMGKVMSHD